MDVHSQNTQKIIGYEEKRKRRHRETRRYEVEIRIEVKNIASEQDRANVIEQEEREVGPRARLEPRNETLPSFSTPNEKANSAENLKCDGQEEQTFNEGRSIDRAGCTHESDVGINSTQAHEVIGQMEAGEDCNV